MSHRSSDRGGASPPALAQREPVDPFDWYVRHARRALLARVRRRFGRQLARSLDPEDLVQESLVTALRVTRGTWRDSHPALVVFLRRIAELRLRHEGRRAGLRRTVLLPDEDPPAATGRVETGGSPALSDPWLLTRARLRGDHRWSLFLHEWMDSSWDTQAFLLERPTAWAVRSLHRRARAELADRSGRGRS